MDNQKAQGYPGRANHQENLRKEVHTEGTIFSSIPLNASREQGHSPTLPSCVLDEWMSDDRQKGRQKEGRKKANQPPGRYCHLKVKDRDSNSPYQPGHSQKCKYSERIVAIPILKNKCVNKLLIELQPLERIIKEIMLSNVRNKMSYTSSKTNWWVRKYKMQTRLLNKLIEIKSRFTNKVKKCKCLISLWKKSSTSLAIKLMQT